MEAEDLEVHNVLPHYDDHGGTMVRKFGSYQGDLILITEFSPPSPIDLSLLAVHMTDINRSVEDDFMFDYCGSFECEDDSEVDKSLLKSLVFFPEGGLLSGLIFSDIKLGWSFRIQVAINIARSLCHLHNNNIIHNDVHCQALAFDSEWTCKLLDMFYALRVEDIYSAHSLTDMKNESTYAAPEVHSEGVCSAASDIYSFGLCLFELCSRVLVTSLHSTTDLCHDSAADVLLDHLPESVPDSLRELVRQMISPEAEYRPTIEDTLDWLESLLTEICLEDEPPLPPLPKLPFPDRRKSSRMTRGTSFALQSQVQTGLGEEAAGSQRGGRGGSYAISKVDADRLKSLAKAKREKDSIRDGGPSASSPLSSTSSLADKKVLSAPSRGSDMTSNIMIGVADERGAPVLEGYLQLKADNLPFYKSKFFFFREHSLVWCSDAKLRELPDRLHFFDLSTARVASSSSPLSLCLELDTSRHIDPLPDQPRKKLFRSSRMRDHLLVKFPSEEMASLWREVLYKEMTTDHCKMCRVKLETPSDRASNQVYAEKDFFCSPMCANYFVATTARGLQLNGSTLQYSHSLRLSQTDIQALDKKLIARRNPKSWKRLMRKQGSDLSHGVAKVAEAEAVALPQSVEEWLGSLGLHALIGAFMESGYGCIGHIIIASLHEEDMIYMNIEDKKTKLLLLTQSRALGETYVKNRNYLISKDLSSSL